MSPKIDMFAWDEKKRTRFSRYKINVSLHNNGNFVLVDNNIRDLYSQIFC